MRARAVAARAAVLVLAAVAAAWAYHGYLPVFVGGGSMAPALLTGDLAIVRRGSQAVRTGEIVLVVKPGWPRGVLHRVDAVMSDGTLRLKGDANRFADRDLLACRRVRGVVALVVPTGRTLDAMQRLWLRWYNLASQPHTKATTERRGREHAPPVQRGAPWLEGPRGGERRRFTPAAAFPRGPARSA